MMAAAISIGCGLTVLLECAILSRILWGRVALPAFGAFLAADVLFSVAMLAAGPLMGPTYQRWYSVGAPCVLALLAAAVIEAIGPVPRLWACAVAALVILAMATTPAPEETRCAVLGACAAALLVALVDQWSGHAALLLCLLLAALVESLAICMGERGSLRPGAFLVAVQLAALAGWMTDSSGTAVRFPAGAGWRRD